MSKTSANKAINSGSAYSVPFLSTTALFPAHRKILEYEMQSINIEVARPELNKLFADQILLLRSKH